MPEKRKAVGTNQLTFSAGGNLRQAYQPTLRGFVRRAAGAAPGPPTPPVPSNAPKGEVFRAEMGINGEQWGALPRALAVKQEAGARSSARGSAVHPAIKREAASNAGLARAAAAAGSVALSASGAPVAALGSAEAALSAKRQRHRTVESSNGAAGGAKPSAAKSAAAGGSSGGRPKQRTLDTMLPAHAARATRLKRGGEEEHRARSAWAATLGSPLR